MKKTFKRLLMLISPSYKKIIHVESQHKKTQDELTNVKRQLNQLTKDLKSALDKNLKATQKSLQNFENRHNEQANNHYQYSKKFNQYKDEIQSGNYYIALTGGKKNVGDFLISKRASDLLNEYRPDRKLIHLDTWRTFADLELINKSKGVIILGGPGYRSDMYPRVYPLTDHLNKIEVPFFLMGLGTIYKSNEIDSHPLTPETERFFKKTSSDASLFGCRGENAMQFLKKNGFANTILTGCPAFYTKKSLTSQTMTQPSLGDPMKMAFSFPAKLANSKQSIAFLEQFQKRFPNVRITGAFHRGITQKDQFTMADEIETNQYIVDECKRLKIDVIDLSYSSRQLEFYDQIDFHIGYRVHAHIYFLTDSKPSYLINEDGRGEELQKILGLQSIDSSLDQDLSRLIMPILESENEKKWAGFKHIPNNLQNNFKNMKTFMERLP